MAKLMGINDDVDTCEVCGKSNLKRVMWIADEFGEVRAYGTTCGAKALGLSGDYSDIEQVKNAVEERDTANAARKAAFESAQKTADEMRQAVAVCRDSRGGYTTVRERAMNAAPERYRSLSVVKWFDPQLA